MGFIKSFGYAARGVWYCIRHERNFRIHLGIAAYVLAFAPYFSLSRAEWAVLAVLMALVLCAEAVNTAVERTVDLASTERQPRARAAKDAAAGAVLLCALAAALVGGCVSAGRSTWRPMSAAASVGAVMAALLVVAGLAAPEPPDWAGQGGALVLCALGGGVLAGFLAARQARKKRRH